MSISHEHVATGGMPLADLSQANGATVVVAAELPIV